MYDPRQVKAFEVFPPFAALDVDHHPAAIDLVHVQLDAFMDRYSH